MSETVVVLICIAIVVGCFTIALGVTLAAYKISDWARGVRYSRACGHARVVAADPVWGNLAEHDEAFDAALRDEFPDPAATDDVRSAWMQAPVRAATGGRPPWDSQQFPAVQLVPLPDFPDSAGPVPAAGERLAVTPPASRGDGEPSNLPGPVDPGSRDHHRAGEPFWTRIRMWLHLPWLRLTAAIADAWVTRQLRREDAEPEPELGLDGEPSNLPGPDSCGQIAVTTPQAAPQGSTEPSPCKSGHENRAGEPVLEGRIVLAPVLGYIDGLALTSTYFERIEQIGVQARVLALAAAA